MNRIIMASAAIILLTAGVGAAEAQQWQGGQNGQWQGQNGQGGRGAGRFGPNGLPGQQQQQQQQAQPQPQQQPPQQQPQGQGGQRDIRVGEPNGRGGGWDNRREDRRDRGGRGGWDRNDRGGDRGWDHGRGGWNNGGQRHQAGRYYAPRGYGLRIWSYGQILPGAYWGSSYVIRDYWRFGLPRPYAGCEWIRSGDDALMVDRRGRVIEVARNLFW